MLLPMSHSLIKLRGLLSSGLRSCRGMRGRSRIANCFERIFANKEPSFSVSTWYKARTFKFNLRDPQQLYAFYLGDILDNEIESISRCLQQKPGVFVDVGANVGLYSIAVAGMLPGIRCLAFEPGRENYQQIVENVRANNYQEQIEVLQLGLSDTAATHSLVYGRPGPNRNSANAAIVDDWSADAALWKDGDFQNSENIQCVVFDDWWSDRKEDLPISFVKADIEGHEPEALAGMRSTIERHRPAMLLELNEYFLAQKGTDRRPTEQYLLSLDYKGFRSKNGRLCELKAAPGQHGADVFWIPYEMSDLLISQ